MQIKEKESQLLLTSFICSVYHNWMFLPKFRNILVYCRYRAVFRCLLSLYPDNGTSSTFMSALFADQQRDDTEEFLKRSKKIGKCTSCVFLVTCWQIGC